MSKRSKPRAGSHATHLVTLQGASAEYGPPVNALRDLVRKGHLPRVRLGDSRRVWLRRADLERLTNANG